MDLNTLLHSPNAANIQLVINAKDLRDCFESWTKFAMQKVRERDEPEYYTRSDLAKMLHVSLPTVYEYQKKGTIPAPVKIQGRVLFNKAEVNEAIRSGKIRIRRVYRGTII